MQIRAAASGDSLAEYISNVWRIKSKLEHVQQKQQENHTELLLLLDRCRALRRTLNRPVSSRARSKPG